MYTYKKTPLISVYIYVCNLSVFVVLRMYFRRLFLVATVNDSRRLTI